MTATRTLLEADHDGAVLTSAFKLQPVPQSRRRGRHGWHSGKGEEEEAVSLHNSQHDDPVREHTSAAASTVERRDTTKSFQCLVTKAEEDKSSVCEATRAKSIFHHSFDSLNEAQAASQAQQTQSNCERWGVTIAKNIVIYDRAKVAPSVRLESATNSLDSAVSSLRSSGLGAQKRRQQKSNEIPILLSPCAKDDADSTPQGPTATRQCNSVIIESPVPFSNSAKRPGRAIKAWRKWKRTESLMSNATTASRKSMDSSTESSLIETPSAEIRKVLLPSGADRSVSTSAPEGTVTTDPHVQDHTVLHLSPMSPLTPGRAAEQHTPKEPPFEITQEFLLVGPVGDSSQLSRASLSCSLLDREPLSATLRRLGAARKSTNYDVDEDEEDVKKDETDLMSSVHEKKEWAEAIVAQSQVSRKAEEVAEDNRAALESAEGLVWKHTTTVQHEIMAANTNCEFEERSNPGSAAADVSVRENRLEQAAKRLSRGLNSFLWQKGMRSPRRDTNRFPMTGTTSYEIAMPGRIAARRTRRGDGWGGRKPPSSWFPNTFTGPLISPVVATSHVIKETEEQIQTRKGLRPLRLGSVASSATISIHQERSAKGETTSHSTSSFDQVEVTTPHRRRGHVALEDESLWEDEEEEEDMDEKKEKAVSYVDSEQDSLEHGVTPTLRVRFPSTLPQPRNGPLQLSDSTMTSSFAVKSFTNSAPLRFKEVLLASSTKLKAKVTKKKVAEDACMVTYTDKTAEGRPLKLKRPNSGFDYREDDIRSGKAGWLKRTVRWTLLTVVIIAIITVILVASTNALNKRHSSSNSAGTFKDVTTANTSSSTSQPTAAVATSSPISATQSTNTSQDASITTASPSVTATADDAVQSAVSGSYATPAARVAVSEDSGRSELDGSQSNVSGSAAGQTTDSNSDSADNDGVARQEPIPDQDL